MNDVEDYWAASVRNDIVNTVTAAACALRRNVDFHISYHINHYESGVLKKGPI